MKLFFTAGPLFYFFFNLRLFFFLLSTRCDLLYANDLDTLLPNYWVGKLKRIPVIYDSHEIFCEVPELQKTPFKKKIWEKMESFLIPKLKYCVTVNSSISRFFKDKYGVDFVSVRNIPEPTEQFIIKSKEELHIPVNKKIIILQGAGINIERGAEELVASMQFVKDAYLLIIGSGDVFPHLEKLISRLNLSEKISLIHKLPKKELLSYTFNADLGISIDKDTNLNYRFSLPNKIFDYIQAGIPVLASDLPEIRNILKLYNIGDIIENHQPEHIAQKINHMLSSPELQKWKANTVKAMEKNKWEDEKVILKMLIKSV